MIVLSPADIDFATDVIGDISSSLVAGERFVTSLLLMQICERVIVPMTDALGYREPGGGKVTS